MVDANAAPAIPHFEISLKFNRIFTAFEQSTYIASDFKKETSKRGQILVGRLLLSFLFLLDILHIFLFYSHLILWYSHNINESKNNFPNVVSF